MIKFVTYTYHVMLIKEHHCVASCDLPGGYERLLHVIALVVKMGVECDKVFRSGQEHRWSSYINCQVFLLLSLAFGPLEAVTNISISISIIIIHALLTPAVFKYLLHVYVFLSMLMQSCRFSYLAGFVSPQAFAVQHMADNRQMGSAKIPLC